MPTLAKIAQGWATPGFAPRSQVFAPPVVRSVAGKFPLPGVRSDRFRKDAHHDSRRDHCRLHSAARIDQLGRDRFGIRREVRAAHRETARPLDSALSGNHGGDRRDWVWLPLHSSSTLHIVGILSLVVLAIAIVARYVLHLAGAWWRTYVICASLALYLNVFVLVVQLFEKVPALKALAPTQKEPPFLVSHLVLIPLFVGLTIVVVKSSGASRSVQLRQSAARPSSHLRDCRTVLRRAVRAA